MQKEKSECEEGKEVSEWVGCMNGLSQEAIRKTLLKQLRIELLCMGE